MRNRFRRGESPAALVDDLLREIAKVEVLAATEAGDGAAAVAAGAGTADATGPESTERAPGMRRTFNRRLLRWRIRTARAAGLS